MSQQGIKPHIPIINWGNSITKGLVFDAPLFEGSGTTTKETISKIKGSIAASGATWSKGLYGIDLAFSAAASDISFTSPAIVNGLAKFSIESLQFNTVLTDTHSDRILNKGATAGAPYFEIGTSSSSAILGELIAHWSLSTGTNAQWTWTTPSVNIWYHQVVTYSFSATTNVPTVYINGSPVSVTTAVAASGVTGADDTVLHIGSRPGADRNWNGDIAYVRIWNRILTLKEARSLYSNPWQIYRQSALRPKSKNFGI